MKKISSLSIFSIISLFALAAAVKTTKDARYKSKLEAAAALEKALPLRADTTCQKICDIDTCEVAQIFDGGMFFHCAACVYKDFSGRWKMQECDVEETHFFIEPDFVSFWPDATLRRSPYDAKVAMVESRETCATLVSEDATFQIILPKYAVGHEHVLRESQAIGETRLWFESTRMASRYLEILREKEREKAAKKNESAMKTL